MVCCVGRCEVVLVRGEDHLRLDREMLGDPEIHESAELAAYVHIGTHRLVVPGDDKIAHVRVR